MAEFLSQQWLEDNPGPTVDGLSAMVQYVVVGGPEGNVTYAVAYVDGQPSVAMGKAAEPDVTLTLSYDEAQKVADGDLTLPVAFMQGGLKAEGDMATILALLATTSVAT